MKLIQLQNCIYINVSANLESIAWFYVHEDYWDQDTVLLETWFAAGLKNVSMMFLKVS